MNKDTQISSKCQEIYTEIMQLNSLPLSYEEQAVKSAVKITKMRHGKASDAEFLTQFRKLIEEKAREAKKFENISALKNMLKIKS